MWLHSWCRKKLFDLEVNVVSLILTQTSRVIHLWNIMWILERITMLGPGKQKN